MILVIAIIIMMYILFVGPHVDKWRGIKTYAGYAKIQAWYINSKNIGFENKRQGKWIDEVIDKMIFAKNEDIAMKYLEKQIRKKIRFYTDQEIQYEIIEKTITPLH